MHVDFEVVRMVLLLPSSPYAPVGPDDSVVRLVVELNICPVEDETSVEVLDVSPRVVMLPFLVRELVVEGAVEVMLVSLCGEVVDGLAGRLVNVDMEGALLVGEVADSVAASVSEAPMVADNVRVCTGEP